MTTSTRVTALDILKETRELFANTHWTNGVLYTTDPTGKKQFCMVGGLCHTFIKHELPEWLDPNDAYPTPSFYAHEALEEDGLNAEILQPVLKAEYELAKTIDPNLPEDANPVMVEDTIISWNDQVATDEYRVRGNASYVIETMDKTIARVEAEQKQ